MRKKGFTLLELLVVMTIIIVLAAMLLPATQKAITNAKKNRALAEMEQFAAIIMQVYSEVGYYVRLEDAVKPDATYAKTTIRKWDSAPSDYVDGRDDDTVDSSLTAGEQSTWAGPYTTYKKYTTVSAYGGGLRPTDPWNQEYRMFWSRASSPDINPAGATGTMVIISGGSDETLDASMTAFDKGDINDDLYFNFNAGIQ